MKRELRLQFFKIVEAKHALSQNIPVRDPWAGKPAQKQNDSGNSGIRDPWDGKPEPQEAPTPTQHILNEQELFQAIKNIPGVRMIPGSYQYNEGTPPWGPEVSFKFEARTQNDWAAHTTPASGDRNLINAVQNAITSKYSSLVHVAGVEYSGNNTYDVSITQKLQK